MSNTLTTRQTEIANEIAREYGVDPSRVLFINKDQPEEPWLPSDVLIEIARNCGKFQAITEKVDRYIPELNQIIHLATVIDLDGRVFERPGVATLGEKIEGGEQMDAHDLAGSRAIVKVLNNAGINPFRKAVLATNKRSANRQTASEAAVQRTTDLRQIHALATEAGLIIPLTDDSGVDRTKYMQFLSDNFGVTSTAGMNHTEREQVINKLKLHLKAKKESE